MKEFELVREHWKEIVKSIETKGIKFTAFHEVNGINFCDSGCEFCKHYGIYGCAKCPFIIVYGRTCMSLFWSSFCDALHSGDVKRALKEARRCLRLINKKCEKEYIKKMG